MLPCRLPQRIQLFVIPEVEELIRRQCSSARLGLLERACAVENKSAEDFRQEALKLAEGNFSLSSLCSK